MRKIWEYLKPAFQGDTNTASAPKLSAFWFVILVTIIHFVWLKKAFLTDNFTYMNELVYSDEATIITLLGLKVWERVKNNQSTNGQS